jgi:hypothetical protein
MMMDIASWLREVRMSTNTSDWNAVFVNNRLDEAANEIERLREVRDMLQAINEAKDKEIAILRAEKHLAALKEGE